MPLDRDVDFTIDRELNMKPISVTPYKISPTDLKVQLKDSLGKRFIRPNVSP